MLGDPYRNQSALTELVSSIEKAYRELLDVRGQVKKAEAAQQSALGRAVS
jgi:hypothetical protein